MRERCWEEGFVFRFLFFVTEEEGGFCQLGALFELLLSCRGFVVSDC